MNDFIANGKVHGTVAQTLMASGFQTNALRPYIGSDGRSYITINKDGKDVAIPLTNTEATLRKDDWKLLDDAIVKAAKPRLRLVGDLRAAGLTYSIPNGMGKTVLETENMSDIGDAIISMDGVREGANDRPVFDLVNLPLPIIHKDFSYSARQIAASRNGGSPLDTTSAELASRKVAEEAEKLALGTLSTYTFGGGTVYGLTNFNNRMTKTITSPLSSGWTPATLLREVLEMKQQSIAAYHYGPWMLYMGTSWENYLDDDYSAQYANKTIRQRLREIEGVQDVRTLDYLSGYSMVLVQMTSDVIREVIGMDITTVQWESHGGMLINFKVMAILVPQVRTDQNSNAGVVHASVSA